MRSRAEETGSLTSCLWQNLDWLRICSLDRQVARRKRRLPQSTLNNQGLIDLLQARRYRLEAEEQVSAGSDEKNEEPLA